MSFGTIAISTKRLNLRKINIDDAEQMYENWSKDKEVTKYLTWEAYENVNQAKDTIKLWIENYKDLRFYQWVIEIKASKEIIGTISGYNYNESINSIEIGYCIGKKWWNKGYTTEAFSAIIPFLFEKENINRIGARHNIENTASGAVMKKCGLKYEGRLRQIFKNQLGYCDCDYYSLIKGEKTFDIKKFWDLVISQNDKELYDFFDESAYINWHNTKEKFTVSQFIQINKLYPNKWDKEIERIEQIGDLYICALRVFNNISFHVVSFVKVKNNKIISIDEYWGDDGQIPDWRKNL